MNKLKFYIEHIFDDCYVICFGDNYISHPSLCCHGYEFICNSSPEDDEFYYEYHILNRLNKR